MSIMDALDEWMRTYTEHDSYAKVVNDISYLGDSVDTVSLGFFCIDDHVEFN